MDFELFKEKRLEQNKDKLRMQCYEEVKELWFSPTDNREAKFNDIVETIVRYLKKAYTFKSIRNDEKEEMWYYQDGIYMPNGVSKIEEELRLIFDERITKRHITAIVLRVSIDNRVNADDFFDQQNKYEYEIPIQDGVLNLKTKNITDYTPEKFFFNKIPVNYKHDAKCPNIIKFITDITKQEGIKQDDAIKTIQEMIGYLLVKNYKYQNAFMLEGKRGSNGKSVLCELIKTFLNKENVSTVNISSLDKIDGFALAGLHNKLLNISAEVSKDALDNKGFFKQLTGNDTITANRKNKTHVQFKNYAKFIFTANELPIPKNADEGFWRRWIRIEFPNKYLSEKEYNKISNEEKKYTFLRDPDILIKMISQEELNGLLNWAIEGLQRLEDKGDFSRKQSIKENELEWNRKTNSILCFCQDMVEQDYDSYVTKEEFRKQYSIYCKSHNIKPMGDKSIKIHLENELFAEESRKSISIPINSFNGQQNFFTERTLVWKGIKFKEKNDDVRGVSPTSPISLSRTREKNELRSEKGVESLESLADNKENDYLHVINCMLVGEKYTFKDLLLMSNLCDLSLEVVTEKAINVGDMMIIDGKYMLVN